MLSSLTSIARFFHLDVARARTADAPAPSPSRSLTATMSGDTLAVTPVLANERFKGSAALDRVARGGAALAVGDTAAIAAVQEALGAMAFYTPAGSKGKLDAATAAAFKNFQTAEGLPVTGKLDRDTLARLDAHAPAPGKTSWDAGQNPGPVPDPVVRDADGKPYMTKGADGKPKPMISRVVVGIGQHRVFRFDDAGNLVKIYACRSGKDQPRGNTTKPAVKVIDAKMGGQALRDLGASKWNEPGAFGEALLALSKIDPATGKKVPFDFNGQEMHGVPNNAKGEPNGIGQNFSHGCVGLKNADIKEIAAAARAGEIVRFDP